MKTRKLILVSLIILFIILFSACFKLKPDQQNMENGDLSVILKNSNIEVITQKNTYGLQLKLNGSFDEKSISVPENCLFISKNYGSYTVIAVVKSDGEIIKKGTKVLTIKGYLKSLGELNIKSEIVESIVIKTPIITASISSDGLSITGQEITVESTSSIFLHCKNMMGVNGIEALINYDPEYVIVGSTNCLIDEALSIVKNNEEGQLRIALAFFEKIDLNDTDVFEVKVRGIKEGESTIEFSEDSKAVTTCEEIECDTNDSNVDIHLKLPKLLGDFDNDNIVGLVDFILFVRHYNSKLGDEKYDVVYDIEPAENSFSDSWIDIYDTCNPDNDVDLSDFIIFTRNYNKSKPS